VHAGRHVPYWRDLFAARHFAPERLLHEDELEALPLLDKDTIVAEGPRMRAQWVPDRAGEAEPRRTSGTTGAGLHFVASRVAVSRHWAVVWRHLERHGIARGTWVAQLGGRVVVPPAQRHPPFHRVSLASRQLLLSGYHLGPHTATHYLEEIDRRAIPWVHGYPSLVVQLADAALAAGRRLPHVRFVTLASESVSPQQRERIAAAFGVTPREHYAQTEAVANASEDPSGVLRLDDDFSFVELVADPVAHPGLLRIVGTSLDNWHQPFIRYDTGDLTRPREAPAQAPGRALADIDGRREDYVILSDGTRVGRLDHVFKDLSFVQAAQIRQARAGAIAVHVIGREPWSRAHEERLRAALATFLGHDLEVAVHVEQELPRTATGKLRLVVREGAR
jgi:phenylacetate-CoA ligase